MTKKKPANPDHTAVNANNEYPDQTALKEQSDLGLHYLQYR